MTTMPLRAPPVFASADSATVPGAFPLAPLVTWIHGVWLTAVQAHPVSVSTASEMPPPDAVADGGPFAPAAGGDIVEPSTVTWHLAALGDVEEIDVARPHAAAVTTANAADRIAAVRS